jgi:asparagine synthase (glutamine-hydrolysing)
MELGRISILISAAGVSPICRQLLIPLRLRLERRSTMCGFAGEIACASHSTASAERALVMLQAILHRGPDGVGLWEADDGSACLLHARLAMVDPLDGQQPMADANEDATIVFNGEIYGFEQLRQGLAARGVVFRTRCDTEVLLHLYLQSGPDFVRDLEGEFAFVLVDRRKGRTMLARDRFGVKPLFVSTQTGLLLFGSEAKAILAHPAARRQLDMTVLERELHGIVLPQDTLFAGICAVEPGTYMLVSRDGAVTRRYADLDAAAAGTLSMSFDEAAARLEIALTEAVRRRFHGDAAVGSFLSGGLDSSAIAALAQSNPGKMLSAFSIDFTGTAESEGAAAGETARLLSMCSVPLAMGGMQLADAFERSVWHAETTIPNAHGVAKLLLAQRAKHDVKAVLTGEGADELHGGYAYFRHAALLAEVAETGRRENLSRFMEAHGPRDGVFAAISPGLRRRLAWSKRGGTPYGAMRAHIAGYAARSLTTAEFRRQARAGGQSRPAHALLDWLSLRAPDARRLDDFTLSRLVALMTDLPRYNLGFLGDRAEMASGLEARLPFLDRQVVDLLWRLPRAFHQHGDESKRLLRRIMASRLPHIVGKIKRPFLAPGALARDLLGGSLADTWLAPKVTHAAGIFRPAAITAMRRGFKLCGRSASVSFYLSSYLTLAMSAHMIVDLFGENFSANLARRSALSLGELRTRLADQRRLSLAAA